MPWLKRRPGFPVVFSPSWLCCPLRFQSSPQTHQWEGFLLFGSFSSFMTPSPGWVSIPNSFVFLFVFYILSYALSKRMGCLSVCLVSSAGIQKLFCGSCSAFKWSFDEFVVFLSCLIPPPSWDRHPYYSILNLFGGWGREWEMNHYLLNSHSILTQYTDCVTGNGPKHSVSNNKYQGFLTLN